MRRSGNIFETESYRGTGIRTVSGTAVVTITLTAVSVLAAVYIIANFDELTARIAIGIANLLSSGFPILITGIAIIGFVMKLKRKMFRRFRRW